MGLHEPELPVQHQNPEWRCHRQRAGQRRIAPPLSDESLTDFRAQGSEQGSSHTRRLGVRAHVSKLRDQLITIADALAIPGVHAV